MFTANITPPYHSWKQFRPVVEQGVECLLATRNVAEQQTPFTPAILRYINAFGIKFTEGRSAASFVQEILGFVVSLPEPVRAEMAPGAEAKIVLQLSIPVRSRQQMSLILAERTVGGEQAVVMDFLPPLNTPSGASISTDWAAACICSPPEGVHFLPFTAQRIEDAKAARQAIEEFGMLKENWDGYGGLPASDQARGHVLSI